MKPPGHPLHAMFRAPVAVVLLHLLLWCGPALAQAPQGSDAAAIANTVIDQLDAGDYAAVAARFTPEMTAAAPTGTLKAVWESLPAQVGARTGRGEPQVTPHDGMQVVVIVLRHERGDLAVQVAVTADGRIAGLFVKPAAPPPPPEPAADADFTERDFSIGSGPHPLPGTLTMPKAASADAPVPAVVLVHGSGPQDRNETVGANRPFLDIARGLAARGIASLRYDKRTLVHPRQFADGDYDVDDETTDDAVAAVAALRGVEGIDPQRIHVFGHSQGGMLAPRIARKSGKVAGLILLAAPARPLLDLLPEQNRYMLSLDGAISADEQAFLDELDASIARVRSGEPMPASETPFDLPVGYWRHFDAIDPLADARSTDLPMLLLQGGRDFQVTATDWQLWQQALGDEPRVTFRHYPALDHLGIAGEGPSTIASYATPGHVDTGLIADVAEWIHTHLPTR